MAQSLSASQLETSNAVATIPYMGTIIIQGRVKYGSVGYKVLNYARFKSRFNDGAFAATEYLSFCDGQYKLSDIQRAINSLEQNGHVRKAGSGRYRYVESGVLRKLENAYKQTLWAATRNGKTDSLDDDELFQD